MVTDSAWFLAAGAELGTPETAGAANNPLILS